VQALGDTNIFSKAGVMIRESLAPDAAHASMFVTALRGTAFQRRPVNGGTSVSTAGSKARPPVWLKLSLRDGVATSYQSKDGKSWTVVETETLNLPSSFYVGLAVTSRDDTATVTANFSDVLIERSANQAPVVSLTTPVDGAVYTAPASIAISAEASDADGTIAWVDFFQGATLLGSDTTSPYTMTWSSVGAGTYELTAVAMDDKGASTTSRAHTIVVNTPPPLRAVVFNPSTDHDTLVKSYLVEIFAAGADPAVDRPVASQDIGKPPVVNGEVTANVTATIDALAPGNYQATVAAVGDSGMVRSNPPVAFTR
jgi:hypothetical protein